MTDGNTAPAAQEAPRVHPSPFDKLQWVGRLQSRRDLTASARRVVVLLAYHHNSTTGRCDPSIATLAEEAAISKRMVNTALDELKAAGIIDWIPGNETTRNKYTLRDVPHWDYQTKAATIPAKRGKGPATVIPFPGQNQSGQADTRGSEPQFTRVVNSSAHEPLKGNPDKGYPVGEVVDDETGAASVSPASPLRPSGGDGPSMVGEDEKQPEVETMRADGRFTFDQLSSEWKAQARDWAESQFQGNQTFIAQASKGFKAVAIKRGWRLTEDKWHDTWTAYSMSEARKRPSAPRAKNAAAI